MLPINKYNTNNKFFIISFTLLLIFSVFVQQVNSACPSTTQFQNCLHCNTYTNGTAYCDCAKDDFYLIGMCIAKGYPCAHTSLPLIFFNSSEYNLFQTVIGPFWSAKVAQVHAWSPFTDPKNIYLNNFNFVNMTDNIKLFWTQAYYFYLIFQPEISKIAADTQNQFLKASILIFQAMAGQTYTNAWNTLALHLKTYFKTTYTSATLQSIVLARTPPIMPCHTAAPNFGILFTSQTTFVQPCPPRCKTCIQQGQVLTCTACIDGYLFNSDLKVCQVCSVPNCLTCSSQGVCSACPAHQYLTNNYCQDCNSQCNTCQTSSDNCQQCSSTFFSPTPTQTGQCVTCSVYGCNYCTEDPSTCAVCYTGFFLNGKICTQCSDNCITCSNQATCGNCAYGYGVVNKACSLCTDPYCLSCDGNVNVCTSCSSGYTLNQTTKKCFLSAKSTKLAIKKRQGCAIPFYTNSQLCFSCQSKYYQVDKYCKKCQPGCQSCLDDTLCYNCIDGFVLMNKHCLKCPNQCLTCSFSKQFKVCRTCKPGYTLVNNVQCVAIKIPYCLVSDQNDKSMCTICRPGYAVTIAGSCIQCHLGCYWTCDPQNITKCTQRTFQLQYYDFYNYGVQAEGCQLFINGNCQKPYPNYYLVNTTKSVVAQYDICLYPCDTCDSKTCLTCVPGFVLANGKCVTDLTCNPTCVSCPQGSQRNYTSNLCVKCSVSNCQACINNTCLQCFEGTYVKNNACVACPSKCRDCYDGQVCKTCNRGYYYPLQMISNIFGTDCLACSSNCATCIIQADICTSCLTGWTLNTNRCVKPFTVGFTFTLDTPYNQFLRTSASNGFITSLANMLKVNTNDIYITSIKQGSTIVSGNVASLTADAANQVYAKLSTITIPGYKVSSYSTTYNSQTQACSSADSDCSNFSGLSTGVIVGIVLVSVIGLLLCLTNLFFCAKYFYNTQDPQKVSDKATKIVDLKTTNNITTKAALVTQPDTATNLQMKGGDVI